MEITATTKNTVPYTIDSFRKYRKTASWFRLPRLLRRRGSKLAKNKIRSRPKVVQVGSDWEDPPVKGDSF
jgi:hypothetical protein